MIDKISPALFIIIGVLGFIGNVVVVTTIGPSMVSFIGLLGAVMAIAAGIIQLRRK